MYAQMVKTDAARVRSLDEMEPQERAFQERIDAEMAVNNARDVYTRRNEGVSIWVVKSSDITASAPSEKGPLFDPSNSKVYRHPTFFDIPDEVGHM